MRRAELAAFAAMVRHSTARGPSQSRGLDLAVAPQAATGADSAQLGSGPRVMGSEPREPGRPGRAGGGARLGAGRGGWGRALAAGMLPLWGREVGDHCPPPSLGPSCLKIFYPFLNTVVASFLLCPFSGLESVFPEPCQKEWT